MLRHDSRGRSNLKTFVSAQEKAAGIELEPRKKPERLVYPRPGARCAVSAPETHGSVSVCPRPVPGLEACDSAPLTSTANLEHALAGFEFILS